MENPVMISSEYQGQEKMCRKTKKVEEKGKKNTMQKKSKMTQRSSCDIRLLSNVPSLLLWICANILQHKASKQEALSQTI